MLYLANELKALRRIDLDVLVIKFTALVQFLPEASRHRTDRAAFVSKQYYFCHFVLHPLVRDYLDMKLSPAGARAAIVKPARRRSKSDFLANNLLDDFQQARVFCLCSNRYPYVVVSGQSKRLKSRTENKVPSHLTGKVVDERDVHETFTIKKFASLSSGRSPNISLSS